MLLYLERPSISKQSRNKSGVGRPSSGRALGRVDAAGAEHRDSLGHVLHSRLEFSRVRIAHQQDPRGDAEIGAVELQLAALHEDPYAWEGHQVLQAVLDGSEFKARQVLFQVAVMRTQALARGLDQVHPAADEIARRQGRGVVGEGT